MKSLKKKNAKCLISIHDVAPPNEQLIKIILSDLKDLGINKINLLIIPDYHASFNLKDYPKFYNFLLAKDHPKKELILHGYYHKRIGSNKSLPFFNNLFSKLFGNLEDEFYVHEPQDAKKRIENGIILFLELFKKKPLGFIPPCWVSRPNLNSLLTEMDFHYAEDHFFIYLLKKNKKIFSPLISFSERTFMRKFLSLIANYSISRILRGSFVPRLAIHPADYKSNSIKKMIHMIIKDLKLNYEFALYKELIE